MLSHMPKLHISEKIKMGASGTPNKLVDPHMEKDWKLLGETGELRKRVVLTTS